VETSGDFPVLETSRLVLREIMAADAPSLMAFYADPEHMQWYGIEPFSDLAAAEARIRMLAAMRAQPNPATPWGITLKEDGRFVGTCGLFAWNRKWRKCSVGYELVKEAQGLGFMQEALTAALSWGFRVMELNRIEAQVHPKNERSIGLLRRLGFAEEGRLREAAFWGNQYHDMLQYSLLRAEWKGNGARL
jgi:ribosomal-protein-alanine N-acetyltransferase